MNKFGSWVATEDVACDHKLVHGPPKR